MNLDNLDVSSRSIRRGHFAMHGSDFPVLTKGTWVQIRKGDLIVYAGYVTRSSSRYLEARDWFYFYYMRDLLEGE